MIKAIETKYKGHHFRSRLEARWAVFFDNLYMPMTQTRPGITEETSVKVSKPTIRSSVTWFYEPEGFAFEGETYLPDFYLPDYDFGHAMFAEVKPLNDFEKAERFIIALAVQKAPEVISKILSKREPNGLVWQTEYRLPSLLQLQGPPQRQQYNVVRCTPCWAHMGDCISCKTAPTNQFITVSSVAGRGLHVRRTQHYLGPEGPGPILFKEEWIPMGSSIDAAASARFEDR